MTTLAPVRAPAGYAPDADTDRHVADLDGGWHPATRILFRLCVVYFGLYVLTTQMLSGMLPLPGVSLPDLMNLPPMRPLVGWIATHVLRVSHPISFAPSGSGDKLLDWTAAFTLLLVAVIATGIWTGAAKRARRHDRLFAWFRLFIRLALATTMLTYGWAKLVPMQMPVLDLRRLVQPYGTMSPMGVLWSFVGSSPAYEMFIGSVEVCSGLLLFWPRTVVLGAMLCAMDAVQIFSLNMMYDVPVKLFSFHLFLLSLFLLAPNLRRLFDLFVRQRPTALRAEPAIGASASGRRKAIVAQLVYGLVMLAGGAYGASRAWKTYGGGAPRSPLFGIWNVEQMAVDGVTRPPLLTDSTRWRRAIIQNPGMLRFQRLDDGFVTYSADLDTSRKTLVLTTRGDSTKGKSPLTYQRPTRDRLLLDGTLDGHQVHMELAYVDPDSFLQRNRGFHLISEVPFNR